MTREEYIAALRNELGVLSESEVSDICADFEEHFSIGLSQGKTEHEISAELGDPISVADTYLSDNIEMASGYKATPKSHAAITQKVTQSGTQAVKAPVDLTGPRLFVVLFNVLFMVWVAFSIYGAILSFWAVTVGMFIGVIAIFVSLAVVPAGAVAGVVLAALALLSFTVCSAVVNFFITKFAIIGTNEYIKWNKKIYNEGF